MGGSPNFAFFPATIRALIASCRARLAHMADLAPSDAMEVEKVELAFSRSLVGFDRGAGPWQEMASPNGQGLECPTRSLAPSEPLAVDRGDLRARAGADGDRPGFAPTSEHVTSAFCSLHSCSLHAFHPLRRRSYAQRRVSNRLSIQGRMACGLGIGRGERRRV